MNEEEVNDTRGMHRVSEATKAIKNALALYPFSRQNTRAIYHSFKKQVDEILLQNSYIPDLVKFTSMHQRRKLANLKGNFTWEVIHLHEIINSAKSINL